MDTNMKGWYTETSPMWPGQAFSLKIKNKILQKKSEYQDILVFER